MNDVQTIVMLVMIFLVLSVVTMRQEHSLKQGQSDEGNGLNRKGFGDNELQESKKA